MTAQTNYTTDIKYIPPEKNVCGIYKIKTSDSKYYIGSSKNCWKRYLYHFNTLKKGIHCNPKMQRKFLTYSSVSWTFELLEKCEEDKLLQTEQLYLSQILNDKKALNCNFVATSPPSQKGRKLSPASKRHLSLLRKGKKGTPVSEKHKQKLSRLHKGRKFTEEHKQKLRKAAIRTEDMKLRISLKLKGRKTPQLSIWKRLVTRFIKGSDPQLKLTSSQIVQLIESGKLDFQTITHLKFIRNL